MSAGLAATSGFKGGGGGTPTLASVLGEGHEPTVAGDPLGSAALPFGTGFFRQIESDGTLTLKPAVGGALRLQQGDGTTLLEIDDTGLGLFGATPIARPSGGDIVSHLTTLGLSGYSHADNLTFKAADAPGSSGLAGDNIFFQPGAGDPPGADGALIIQMPGDAGTDRAKIYHDGTNLVFEDESGTTATGFHFIVGGTTTSYGLKLYQSGNLTSLDFIGGGGTGLLRVGGGIYLHMASGVVSLDSLSGGSRILRGRNGLNGATAGTGLKLGLNATDFIGLYGVTCVQQPSTTGTTAGFAAGVGTGVNDDSTFTGGTGSAAYTVGDVVLALKQIGILAA